MAAAPLWLMNGDVRLPRLCRMEPGCRFVFGNASEFASQAPPLPAGFEWEVGTVGCIATDGASLYVVTAGHVVIDILATTDFPAGAGCRFCVGFDAASLGRYTIGPDVRITPASALDANGLLVDAVAFTLRPLAAPARWTLAPRDTPLVGVRAHLLVERDEPTPSPLWGTIENTVDGGLFLRFDGERSVKGDSGAPILVPEGQTTYLVGFHLEGLDDSSVSRGVQAAVALEHMGLQLA